MKTHLIWLAVAVLAFGLGYKFPKRTSHQARVSHQPSVESIRQEWIANLQKEPPNSSMVIHMGAQGTPGDENYVIGIVQAGFDTHHPTIWTRGADKPQCP